MKKIVTPVQRDVLVEVKQKGQLSRPRGTLEKLHKKGLVSGKRNTGWTITPLGEKWLSDNNLQ